MKRGQDWTEAWPYIDAMSQTQYWSREIMISADEIQDVASADIYWNAYLEKEKNKKHEIVLTINSNYDLESIRPWQFVSVYNTDLELKKLQIQKVDYKADKVVLYLDQYKTFAQTVLSNK